jgi:hypothetical protein
MTPAALLVCMTIVTNVGNGSEVSRDCHYQAAPVQPVAMAPADAPEAIVQIIPASAPADAPVASIHFITENLEAVLKDLPNDVTALGAKPRKAAFRMNHQKPKTQLARVHRREAIPRPTMAEIKNQQYRRSWVERLFKIAEFN